MQDDAGDLNRTIWYFVVDGQDHVRRFPLTRWSRFHNKREAVAEFAGSTSVRMIEVGLLLRDRKPVDVFHLHCGLVPVDSAGRLDEHRSRAQLREAMEGMSSSRPSVFRQPLPPSVVDARERFDERLRKYQRARYDAKYKWRPSDAVWAQVRQIIWKPKPAAPARHTPEVVIAMPQHKERRPRAFTAVLFEGDLVGDNVGSVTSALTARFGLPVLVVSSLNTDGGGGGEGATPESYGGPDAQRVAQHAAYDLYVLANHDVPSAKTETGLDAWAAKRAKALQRLAGGLENATNSRKRGTLRNRAERIRAAAEELVFGFDNWELADEDRRWQAERSDETVPDNGER